MLGIVTTTQRALRDRLAKGRPANTGLAARIRAADAAAWWEQILPNEVLPGLTAMMVWDEHTARRTDGEG